jgi:hypothetical protein
MGSIKFQPPVNSALKKQVLQTQRQQGGRPDSACRSGQPERPTIICTIRVSVLEPFCFQRVKMVELVGIEMSRTLRTQKLLIRR